MTEQYFCSGLPAWKVLAFLSGFVFKKLFKFFLKFILKIDLNFVRITWGFNPNSNYFESQHEFVRLLEDLQEKYPIYAGEGQTTIYKPVYRGWLRNRITVICICLINYLKLKLKMFSIHNTICWCLRNNIFHRKYM